FYFELLAALALLAGSGVRDRLRGDARALVRAGALSLAVAAPFFVYYATARMGANFANPWDPVFLAEVHSLEPADLLRTLENNLVYPFRWPVVAAEIAERTRQMIHAGAVQPQSLQSEDAVTVFGRLSSPDDVKYFVYTRRCAVPPAVPPPAHPAPCHAGGAGRERPAPPQVVRGLPPSHAGAAGQRVLRRAAGTRAARPAQPARRRPLPGQPGPLRVEPRARLHEPADLPPAEHRQRRPRLLPPHPAAGPEAHRRPAGAGGLRGPARLRRGLRRLSPLARAAGGRGPLRQAGRLGRAGRPGLVARGDGLRLAAHGGSRAVRVKALEHLRLYESGQVLVPGAVGVLSQPGLPALHLLPLYS